MFSLESEILRTDSEGVNAPAPIGFVARFLAEVAEAVDKLAGGNVSEASRQSGVPISSFHSMLERSTIPRRANLDKLQNWIAKGLGRTYPDSPSSSNRGDSQEGLSVPQPSSPRDKAIALIESLDGDQIADLLKIMRRHIARRWQQDPSDDTEGDQR